MKRMRRIIGWSVLSIVVLLGLTAAVLYYVHTKPVSREVGTTAEMAPYIERLLKTKPTDAALIVMTVQDSDDFIQLTVSKEGIRLHYPIATDRQEQMAPAMREALKAAGCTVDEDSADDVIFLEAVLGGDEASVTKALTGILRDAFSIGADTKLVFDHAGLND
jgi:hypothetical protein